LPAGCVILLDAPQTTGSHALGYQLFYRTTGGELSTLQRIRTLNDSTTQCWAAVGLTVRDESALMGGEGEGEGELLHLDFGDDFFFTEGIQGEGEGGTEGEAEGEGDPKDNGNSCAIHSADQDENWRINLSELLRVIQLFNSGGFHCDAAGEDGYAPGAGVDQSCTPHSSDYNPQDWQVSLSELLRLIQFFNSASFSPCPNAAPPTEDGFCTGLPNGLGPFVVAQGTSELPYPAFDCWQPEIGNFNSAQLGTQTIYVCPPQTENCDASNGIEVVIYVSEADKFVVLNDDVIETCDGDAVSTLPTDRQYIGAPLEPFDGVWSGVGQDTLGNVEDFVCAVEPNLPAMLMFYMNPGVLDGNLAPDDLCRYTDNIISTLKYFESDSPYCLNSSATTPLIPQIALSLHGILDLGSGCGQNEKHQIHIKAADGVQGVEGTFTIGWGAFRSGPIDWDDTEQDVENALNDLLAQLQWEEFDPGTPCGINQVVLVEADHPSATERKWTVEYTGGLQRRRQGAEAFSLDLTELNCDGLGSSACGGQGAVAEYAEFEDDRGEYLSLAVPVDIPLSADAQDPLYGNAQEVIDHLVDAFKEIYASGPNESNRPFFLRIGYEVNSPVNNYCPHAYKTAYRRIISALRAEGIEFASVWHVEAGANAWEWLPFYPGDGYVDWIGTSLFWREHFDSTHTPPTLNYISQQAVRFFAQARNKPLMIAESSAIERGVQTCAAEADFEDVFLPETPDADCSGVPNQGEQAWNAWFVPYFAYIEDNAGIKAFSYINNAWSEADYVNWMKDARIGQDAYVASAFAAEMAQNRYKGMEDIPTELGGCHPHYIRTDGREWLRFLPTGDIVITEGTLIQNTAYSSETPPAFAIVNHLRQPLLAVHPETGDVYLRGSVHNQHDQTSLAAVEGLTWSYEANDGILAKLDSLGKLNILQGKTVNTPDNFNLPPVLIEQYESWPSIPDGEAGSYAGYDCPIAAPHGDCLCFTKTGWYQASGPAVCIYPEQQSENPKSIPDNGQKSAWDGDTGLMDIDDHGNVHLPIGQVYSEGITPPSGDTEHVLVECDSQVMAKLVVQEGSGIPQAAHLWLAGSVIVAHTPSGVSACGAIFLDEEHDIVVAIDSDGNLILRGMVYVEGKVLHEVHNWPYGSGGAVLYE
jgi:hypothetical protein